MIDRIKRAFSCRVGFRSAPLPARGGFTLLELLAVILILAILLGLMTHAAQLVIRAARERRFAIACRVLETALSRYRDEYGAWPIPRVPNTLEGDYDPAYYVGSFTYRVSGDANKHWFTLLRKTSANPFNPKNIPFIDETTIFTVTSQGRTPLHVARAQPGQENEAFPFVGVSRRGDTVYFTIEINVDRDTARVR